MVTFTTAVNATSEDAAAAFADTLRAHPAQFPAVTVTGRRVKFTWTNPHVAIHALHNAWAIEQISTAAYNRAMAAAGAIR